jgi:hypothetical protein
MPIFAHLDAEEKIQVNDRTRFDAGKTYSTVNETEFTYLAIAPGYGSAQIPVYNTDRRRRVLDWEFDEWRFDVDISNQLIDFNEGGSTLTATLTPGSYTFSGLLTEIQTQLLAAGALIYTVTNDGNGSIIISANGVFDLVKDGPGQYALCDVISYFEEFEDKDSYTSNVIEFYPRQVSVYAGIDRAQVQTVTCLPNTAAQLQNKYFFLWSGDDATKYYVWFNSDTIGVDPSISGAIPIEVAITTGDTASAVATAVAAAIDLEADFSALSSSAVVTITNSAYGWSSPAQDGTSGFTFSVTTQGQSQVSDFIHIQTTIDPVDRLFSTDQDLELEEPSIRKYVPEGKNSFKSVHRHCQTKIIEYLDRHGFINIYGGKYEKEDCVNVSEFREWSRYMALRIIFEALSNASDDVFSKKRDYYSEMEVQARQRAILRIDTDKDGVLDDTEGLDQNSIRLVFR